MGKIKKYLKDTLCRISPELLSRYQFKDILGEKLDLSNPTGLNAKITWLKLNKYRNDRLVAQCSDKYGVRDYIRACDLQEILNELYGVWERVEDIDWKELPESFVLKCNHGCGYNWICTDKKTADFRDAYKKLKQWMREDYWLSFAELQYRNIPKKILCEKYLGDSLVDYKFYCFNGTPKYVLVCVGRVNGIPSHVSENADPKFYFFNRDWEMCPLNRDSREALDVKITRPENMEKMWETAERLCRPFPFVRVDLYNIGGKIVFGELTFTPSAGLDQSRLPETDHYFGDLLNLS